MAYGEVSGFLGFTKQDEEQENQRNYNAGYYYNKGKQDAKIKRKENNTMTELEAKMEFLKKHSDSPEELELAKMVLGIK